MSGMAQAFANGLIFQAAVEAGMAPRICTCGVPITGRTDVDAYCRFKDHVAAVEKVRRG